MIDVYMLGMYLNLRCHVFLEVLPNSSASPKKKIFLGCRKYLLFEKTIEAKFGSISCTKNIFP